MERVLVVLICSSVLLSWVVSETNSNVTDCENAKKIYRDAGYKDEGIFTTGQQGILILL